MCIERGRMYFYRFIFIFNQSTTLLLIYFLTGAAAGVLGAGAIAVGGAVQGVSQVVRGAKATPAAITQPRHGKWWSDVEGKWILTNLETEMLNLIDIPHDDDDILGDAKKDAAATVTGTLATKVVDTSYYDALEIAPGAEPGAIKRQYYLLARKYHPDKVGKDDHVAAEKFKDIAEAYQVLSNPETRVKYDAEGKDGLSPDRTEVNGVTKADPAILFAFLFGSDKFGDYIGRLAMATSALVADSPKIGQKEAKLLQQRRVTRLAIKLAERLNVWITEDYSGAKAIWESTAADLGQASYGGELTRLIGKIYTLSAEQFIGSTDSGVGMPSISSWAKGQRAKMKSHGDASRNKRDGLMAGLKMMETQQRAAQELAKAVTEEEKGEKEAALEQAQLFGTLNIMWTTTVVDISSSLHQVVQMLLHDQSVDADTRKRRAEGLKEMGEIFMGVEVPDTAVLPEDAKTLYEEAAFAAMLETVKRKEEQSHEAKY